MTFVSKAFENQGEKVSIEMNFWVFYYLIYSFSWFPIIMVNREFYQAVGYLCYMSTWHSFFHIFVKRNITLYLSNRDI